MTIILLWVVIFATINAAAWIAYPKDIKFRRMVFIASFVLSSLIAWFLVTNGG